MLVLGRPDGTAASKNRKNRSDVSTKWQEFADYPLRVEVVAVVGFTGAEAGQALQSPRRLVMVLLRLIRDQPRRKAMMVDTQCASDL